MDSLQKYKDAAKSARECQDRVLAKNTRRVVISIDNNTWDSHLVLDVELNKMAKHAENIIQFYYKPSVDAAQGTNDNLEMPLVPSNSLQRGALTADQQINLALRLVALHLFDIASSHADERQLTSACDDAPLLSNAKGGVTLAEMGVKIVSFEITALNVTDLKLSWRK